MVKLNLNLNNHVLCVIFVLAVITGLHLMGGCICSTPVKVYGKFRDFIYRELFGIEGFDDLHSQVFAALNGGAHENASSSRWMKDAEREKRDNEDNEIESRFGKVFTDEQPNNFFAMTKYGADCCPSAYASSGGCACLSKEQIDFIKKRGGNRLTVSK
jgi:hypothetical protein